MKDDDSLPNVPARRNVQVAEMVRWKRRLPGVTAAVLPVDDGRPNPVVVGNPLYCVTFSPGMVWAFDAKTRTTPSTSRGARDRFFSTF